MNDYKAVLSGMKLSQRIVDCLEVAAPAEYQFDERAKAIRAANDILQGRSTRSVDELLAELEKCDTEQMENLRNSIRDFMRQMALLTQVYNKRCGNGQLKFNRCQNTADGTTLKVINQEIYDQAVKQGFSHDFFRYSSFNGVTFYCLPDHADFSMSELHNCKFAVCRISKATFSKAYISGAEFYSSVLNHVDFCGATLSYISFRDCELSHVMLQMAKLKVCSTIDCTMDGVDFAGATLDGCTFGRVTAGTIRNLNGAMITQGGATEEECRQNREAIYRALGIKEEAA